jgi:drug/metabolite transporter (DMT)-like permease
MRTNSSNVNRGIMLMLISMFFFSCLNVIVKDVTQNYPVWQVVFFRVFCGLPVMYYMMRRDGAGQKLTTSQLQALLLMSVVGSFGIYCLFTAFRLIPLADATALAYSSILFITALSAPVLKEHVGIYRWCAIAAGFIGVIIMASPQGHVDINCFYALAFALMDATMVLIIRILSRSISASTIVFYFSIFASAISGVMMLYSWKNPTVKDFLMLAFMGLGGGIAQLFLTNAYRLAPAVVVAPMSYSSMLWGMLFGFMFFNEKPTMQLTIGGAIIIAAGLFIIYRESVTTARLNKEAQAAMDLNTADQKS